MDAAGTGGTSWPLKSASGENPTVTMGKPITFLFTDIPIVVPGAPLANYCGGCFLTLQGSVIQNAESPRAIPRDVLPGLLIDSVDWTQTFLGAALSTNNIKGKFLPIIEFTAGGFQYGQRQIGDIPAVAGAQPFSITVWLPAFSDRRGHNLSDTARLALELQPSQCKINFQQDSVLSDYSPAATWLNVTARLTADLDGRQELVCGVPMEWVLHEIAAAGSSVRIEGFGRNSAMNGVEQKGGVAFLGELTSVANQDGIISPELIQQISFQWRGQGELQDIQAWLNKFINLLPNDRPQQGGGVAAGTAATLNDFAGFPYQMDNGDVTTKTTDLSGLRFFPWVLGGRNMRLTDLQTADQDQTYYVTQTGGFSGTHQIVAQYARVLQGGKIDAWEALVRAAGLPQYVFQTTALSRVTRLPLNKHLTTPDQKTYLATALQPANTST